MNLDDFDYPTILTRIVAAVVILIITALIAKLVKNLLSRQLTKVSVLQREDASGHSLGESLGTIVSLVVWLLGLVAILNLFALNEVLSPLQDLVNGIIGVLPGIVGAALIFFIGLVLARIVRQLVETGLRTAGADRWAARVGGGRDTGRDTSPGDTTASYDPGYDSGSTTTASRAGSSVPPLSQIAGQLVFALILIVVSISALQVLGIEAIAQPATRMLSLILDAIPAILAASLLLGIGYLISRFVVPLLESTLRGLGVDRALSDLGAGAGTPTGTTSGTAPSTVLARVGQVAIMLFFAIAATRVLGFPEVTEVLNTVLRVAGGIVLGVVIIGVGVFVANLVPRFIDGQPGQVVRYATIALFVAIGLRSMGLADSIVNLAFGAVVVGLAAAAAIAFGLGGRQAAARELERLQSRAHPQVGAQGATSSSSMPGDPLTP